MRGTLPRVRIDQLMGFAWKWLVPASLANIFVTAGAIVVIAQLGRRMRTDRVPGLGIVKGLALTITRAFQPKVTIQYPEVVQHDLAEASRPPAAALRRIRHAQVRDLLPVRRRMPHRVHRHGRR